MNFTKAAEKCNVSQPSLTRAIKQLEGELGGDLFRRERPHAQLTELGERMHPLLEAVLRQRDRRAIAGILSQERRGWSAEARDVAYHCTELLMPHLRSSSALFAQLEVKLLRGTASGSRRIPQEGRGRARHRLRYGRRNGTVSIAGRFSRKVFICSCNNQRDLAARSSVEVNDLRQERFLRRELLRGKRALRRRFCAIADAISIVVTEVSSERDLIALVEAGFGVALLPRSDRHAGHAGMRRVQRH